MDIYPIATAGISALIGCIAFIGSVMYLVNNFSSYKEKFPSAYLSFDHAKTTRDYKTSDYSSRKKLKLQLDIQNGNQPTTIHTFKVIRHDGSEVFLSTPSVSKRKFSLQPHEQKNFVLSVLKEANAHLHVEIIYNDQKRLCTSHIDLTS